MGNGGETGERGRKGSEEEEEKLDWEGGEYERRKCLKRQKYGASICRCH